MKITYQLETYQEGDACGVSFTCTTPGHSTMLPEILATGRSKKEARANFYHDLVAQLTAKVAIAPELSQELLVALELAERQVRDLARELVREKHRADEAERATHRFYSHRLQTD